MKDIWITYDSRLFVCFPDHCAELVVGCGVYSVILKTDKLKTWVCGYCGSTNLDSLNCSHCQAPRKSRVRKGELHIQGYLPLARILDDLHDDFRLVVANIKCDDPRVLREQDIIMNADRCKVVDKWIDCIVAMTSDENEVITLNLNVEADISIRFPERD